MKLLRSEDGSALLEFSLILPIVIFMFIGMINLAVAIEQGIVVSEAAEAGTRYGTLPSKSTDLAGMQTATNNAASGVSGFSPPVVKSWCSCVPAGPALPSCSSTCPNSSTPDRYIQVQTSATVPALANYPGLASSFALKGFSALRVQ